eukprot:COSAG06_NODE_3807_length_4889_cov_2.558038_6_plen_123_part_00
MVAIPCLLLPHVLPAADSHIPRPTRPDPTQPKQSRPDQTKTKTRPDPTPHSSASQCQRNTQQCKAQTKQQYSSRTWGPDPTGGGNWSIGAERCYGCTAPLTKGLNCGATTRVALSADGRPFM